MFRIEGVGVADQSGGNGRTGTMRVKSGLAQMLKGGVIMDVVNAEQARIAEEAGACAVMALERIPADIRAHGGVARMSDPDLITGIKEAVSIPVMAKCRIGHFVEAQILQSLEIDYIDESEVLTPADEANHVDKHAFEVPFVCGATDLGEALRRINEGAAMIRTKGEAGTGNVVEAVRHMRAIHGGIARLRALRGDELYAAAKDLRAPYELVVAGRRDRAAAGGQLLRRRHRHPGRRGPDDAARRRRRVRRQRHLQERRTPPLAPARSSRPSPTTTTRPSSRASRPGSRTPCPASRSAPSARASCCRRGAGNREPMGSQPRIGVLAVQGAVAEHERALAEVGAVAVRVRDEAGLVGPRRARDPGRRDDDPAPRGRGLGARSTRCAPRAAAACRSSARARG